MLTVGLIVLPLRKQIVRAVSHCSDAVSLKVRVVRRASATVRLGGHRKTEPFMRSALLAASAALALISGAAFAQGPAIANDTTTSMGSPSSSPEYAAPRSAAVPGLAPQQREAQQRNAAQGRQVDQGVTAPVQGPTNPVTGRAQVTPR